MSVGIAHPTKLKLMDEKLQKLHLAVGTIVGKDKTCGNKIDYATYESAIEAAERMNKKPNTRNKLEAYPCGFCNGWHIGREMSAAELESYLESSSITQFSIYKIKT
jgi:hypothetical protein